MRIRSLKPEFWKSESMSAIDSFSRLTAIALLNASDDYGYFPANPTILRGDIFPFEDVEKVSRALAKVSIRSREQGAGIGAGSKEHGASKQAARAHARPPPHGLRTRSTSASRPSET